MNAPYFYFLFSLLIVSCSRVQRAQSGIWETLKNYVPFLSNEEDLSKELNQFSQRADRL